MSKLSFDSKAMRSVPFVKGEYYHIYNRGVEKRTIFYNNRDYERFILSMFALRGEKTIPHFSRLPCQSSALTARMWELEKILNTQKQKLVEIVCFCLMPNHYHLLLKQTQPDGISTYMHRLGTSFTKYINKKRERSGHLFESRFQAVHVNRNEYLIYLSRYIHRNPKEMLPNQNLVIYPWSSYPDYIGINRWEGIIHPTIVLDQFQNSTHYHNYVENDDKSKIDKAYLIDSA